MSDIRSLKHVRGFQSKNSIEGLFVFACCVVSSQGCCIFIQYSLLVGCFKWILMQPQTQVIDYALPGLKWHIRLRIGISHPSNSGKVVCGKCYISHCFYFFWYLFWLFCLFFVFALMSLGSSLSNQKPILTFLLPFWLIIKLYHDYYDSITIYYITKLYYSRLFYVVVSLFT